MLLYSIKTVVSHLKRYLYSAKRAQLDNKNVDCMLLSGVLVVMTFEITFLGSGMGVDYRYF